MLLFKLLFTLVASVVAAIELVESGLCEKRGLKKLRNKLSFLMIESFQNIIRYGDEPENTNEKYRKELFLVRNVNNYFYIVSANIVENSKINFVKFKLEEVNNLNKKELNKLYQHVLTNNEFTEAGGAGLGFIEMVRKTEENLLYDFDRINEKYSYFYLIIKIRGLDAEKTQVHPISIDWVKNFHINTSKNDVIAIHKGDFLPKVIGPAINIVEKNIKNKLVNVQKLAFYLIHETLQNINQLPSGINDEKKAIFIISKNNSNYFVSTGNYIKDTKASLVKKQLDAMKKLDLKQLKNFL
ncbi:MAG: hypothetical protein B6I20_03975 [Bacteroidetes bacterium 4572_117]|nr:MAG: hypothetical protein B6I20_03975 [Bacteroidetes bacterium 4572_117]